MYRIKCTNYTSKSCIQSTEIVSALCRKCTHFVDCMTYNMIRVRTILVLGYWVLGNIHRYWIVLLLGDIFCCSDTQYNTDQHRPHASEQFSSTCDLYSDSRNRLSGHCADMLLFIKHNHCHHHRVLGFFVVIAISAVTIIEIDIEIAIFHGDRMGSRSRSLLFDLHRFSLGDSQQMM